MLYPIKIQNFKKLRRAIYFLALALCLSLKSAAYEPRFSTAGFYAVEGTGRKALSMNPAWRFFKGTAPGAETVGFDDADWEVVSLPHGIELLPVEASGCINYQGIVWYRKHFTPDPAWQGSKLFLHFEGVMGKARVYVNGTLLAEHYGGFLPIVTDISQQLNWNGDNIIAVCADNSNDPSYPPGKAQDVLDYAYFGGIYRDCWLVVHNDVFVTSADYEDETAGGGVFVSFGNVSDNEADVNIKVQVRNERNLPFNGSVECRLTRDNLAISEKATLTIPANSATNAECLLKVERPCLWSPDNPQLYHLYVLVKDNEGNTIDGLMQRVGIRSIEFKGADGFYLNGKPYNVLIGTNRHQEFAVLGNAVPNSLHWRDAKKLRDAGLKVIRSAHYPQDPAFMDACDELGLFVIVNTPGWQYWNDNPIFGTRVLSDIRRMVRRDRNHPCVLMWEPVLNETHYPDSFAANALNAVNKEYPYPYCYSACDATARGSSLFPVLFSHPSNGDTEHSVQQPDSNRVYFTREWGDYVDDWNSHNSPNRVSRAWGETPMLVQALHYARPDYPCTCYDALCRTTRQHVGGCFWHAFDHQRGYHPTPFYGGIMDGFRQPKYSYYMFQAQRPVTQEDRLYETGPMIYIAHEMTPFSPSDVTVFTNCDEVRLQFCEGGNILTYTRPDTLQGMPAPPVVFKDVYHFTDDKNLSGRKKQSQVFLLAEGLIDGQVVATHKVCPARRPAKLLLHIDNENIPLRADGSDCVVVTAALADADGNIKRLSNETVKFHLEGEGRLLGSADKLTNPIPLTWGTAPVIVQASLLPDTMKLTASVLFEGSQKPLQAEIEIESIPAQNTLVFSPDEAALLPKGDATTSLPTGFIPTENLQQMEARQKENADKLKVVEKQQADFGEK